MTDSAQNPYEAPSPPDPGSPGAEPSVTPIPDEAATAAQTTEAGGVPAEATVPPAPPTATGAAVRVRVMAGVGVNGEVLPVGQVVDVQDTPAVRSLIEGGFLKLAE